MSETVKKTDSLECMGMPNPFLMRNGSSCPFSGRIDLVSYSFWDRLHISICIAVFSAFPASDFPRLPVFNRLGGDSKLFSLFTFTYRCFSSSRIFLKCTVLPWPVTLGPRLPASMVTGIGDSTRDARLHLSIFAYLLCGFHLIAYTCDIYFLLYSSCLML